MAESGGKASSAPIRALLVMGTRPEAIKLAPLYRRMQGDPAFEPRVCVTAQHRELLDEPLALFSVPVHHDLDLMRAEQDPLDLFARALPGLAAVLEQERPDVVLVQGDTTSAFAGAFAAYHLKVPVAHVEAGLRTGRRFEPFPEEMNRRLVTRLAGWHFAPTEGAREALLRDGVPESAVVVSGNTVVDAVQQVAAMPLAEDQRIVTDSGRRLVLLTCHRREHHGETMRAIFEVVRRVADDLEDVEFVFPVHPHPRVRATADEVLSAHPRVRLCAPLSYHRFADLLSRAALILTDSGGVQEEAPSLGVPALVLRRATERQEGVDAGVARLVGTEPAVIEAAMRELLTDEGKRSSMQRAVNPYGDGRASERICVFLQSQLRRAGVVVPAVAEGEPV